MAVLWNNQVIFKNKKKEQNKIENFMLNNPMTPTK